MLKFIFFQLIQRPTYMHVLCQSCADHAVLAGCHLPGGGVGLGKCCGNWPREDRTKLFLVPWPARRVVGLRLVIIIVRRSMTGLWTP